MQAYPLLETSYDFRIVVYYRIRKPMMSVLALLQLHAVVAHAEL